MKEDLQWRIGDGNSIRVWTKPWLKNSETIMWHLLATTKTWTRELVTLLTMICVLGRLMKWLPISTKMMLNNFIPFLFSTLWLVINLFENLQEMVIILCSAHHNIMENMLDNSNFFFFFDKGNWMLLWKLQTPHNIKNFLWRLFQGFLPTRFNLRKKHVLCPLDCVTCEANIENEWMTPFS